MTILYVILGIVLGVFIPEYSWFLSHFDTMFLRLLSLVVPYLMFSAMVISVSYVHDNMHKDKGLIYIILYYISGTVLSVVLGLGIACYLNIGESTTIHDILGDSVKGQVPNNIIFMDFILNMIPSNLITVLYHNDYIQLFVLSYLFAIAIKYTEYKDVILKYIRLIYGFSLDIVNLIMLFVPYALLSLSIKLSSSLGVKIIVLLELIVLVFSIWLLRYIILLLEIYFIGCVSPWKFIVKSMRYKIIAFMSSSSKVALPILAEDMTKMGCSRSNVQYTISLASIFSMIGFGIMVSVTSVYVINIYGLEVDLLTMGIVAVLLIIGCMMGAGIPSSSVIVITSILSFLQLPLDIVPLILAVDRIMDMFSTLMNAVGICGYGIIVDSYQKTLDYKKYMN